MNLSPVPLSLRNLLRLLFVTVTCLSFSTAGRAAQPEEGGTNSIILVTTFLDELNIDGNCSLREAIRAANLNMPVDACPAGSAADMDIILLESGIYLLTVPGAGEDQGLTGDLDILGNTQIGGNGPDNTIIDTNHLDRAFEVISPAPPDTITVKFTSLTIRNGSTPSTGLRGGGGILNNAYSTLEIDLVTFQDNLTQQTGGGLDNIGTARLNNVTLTGNQSVVVGAGGGIFNSGNITLSNSLFYNNSSTMYGGGLDNSLRASLFNITFSGNSSAEGGGVFNDGEIDVYNSTFTANSSGFYHQGSAQRIKNTIIANSTPGDNCAGTIPITSLGHNLDSGSTCNFTGFGDQQNTDPLLGLLENNLGPTLTHALLTSSPAIDTGDNNDCPTTDQRGSLRPANGGFGLICDIGAFELNALFPRLIFLPITNR